MKRERKELKVSSHLKRGKKKIVVRKKEKKKKEEKEKPGSPR